MAYECIIFCRFEFLLVERIDIELVLLNKKNKNIMNESVSDQVSVAETTETTETTEANMRERENLRLKEEERSRSEARLESKKADEKARENLRLAKDYSISFEATFTRTSDLHFAIQDGDPLGSAGDYLNNVAEYEINVHPNNDRTNEAMMRLAEELRSLRGEVENAMNEEGRTPEGFRKDFWLQKIRDVFARLNSVNI